MTRHQQNFLLSHFLGLGHHYYCRPCPSSRAKVDLANQMANRHFNISTHYFKIVSNMIELSMDFNMANPLQFLEEMDGNFCDE